MESGAREKRPVRINIFNQSYTLLTSGDEREVHELATMVDELMSTIAKSGNMDSTRIAVLTSLHLADKLRSRERELEDIKQRVSAKSREFTVLLDQAILETDAGASSAAAAPDDDPELY